MGDPAGIGGELTVALYNPAHPPYVALDDPDRLAQYNRVPIVVIDDISQVAEAWPRGLPVLPVKLAVPAIPGRPDPANAPAVIASIERAVRLAQQGRASAVVTNPISKSVLHAAGFPHPGHTEFLAALTNAPHPVMMLSAPALRVVPITIHLSLRNAIDQLSVDLIVRTARVTEAALRRDFGLSAPRLAFAGLNPHAGENSSLGTEEATIIIPALDILRAEGLNVSGPHPADTLFTLDRRATYDVALCMYHDQALIPLKTLDRDRGVNVTLGLPIIRTSPDHGTAFDIAGTHTADPSSLRAALHLAQRLAARSAGLADRDLDIDMQPGEIPGGANKPA